MSEELSAQANAMDQAVGYFKLSGILSMNRASAQGIEYKPQEKEVRQKDTIQNPEELKIIEPQVNSLGDFEEF